MSSSAAGGELGENVRLLRRVDLRVAEEHLERGRLRDRVRELGQLRRDLNELPGLVRGLEEGTRV